VDAADATRAEDAARAEDAEPQVLAALSPHADTTWAATRKATTIAASRALVIPEPSILHKGALPAPVQANAHRARSADSDAIQRIEVASEPEAAA
jgi:hypothetical protein